MAKQPKNKVLVAMSGGVDSSVAAALLLRKGYDVVGCFMRLGSPGETLDTPLPDTQSDCKPNRIGKQGCCSVSDAADARLVAAELGVPFYVCNFKDHFGKVMDYFADEYAAGRTPNPCVRCNDWLKFGKLHEYAAQIGAKAVASGHYARCVDTTGGRELRRGIDGDKDQSYVLFGAQQHKLDEMLLPVGGLEKKRVRELAQEFGLPVFDKPDSQEICFVPDNDYAAFVEKRRPTLAGKHGKIVDKEGKELGEHAGQHRYTVGQRRGVGVALGRPIYVVDKDPATNTVTVGERDDLAVNRIVAHETNWLIRKNELRELQAGMEAVVQVRAHGEPLRAIVSAAPEEGRLDIRLHEPHHGVAPGQAAVCYDAATGTRVLGGGWITSTG